MLSSNELLNKLLKSTSRSFYLSLRVLPPDMRPAAALAYLLCRTADSMTDTDLLPEADRLTVLNRFYDLIERFPMSGEEWNEFATWLKDTHGTSASPESRLLSNIGDMGIYLERQTKTDQALIKRVVEGVIRGMRIDLKTFGGEGAEVKAFQRAEDLEMYLHWIGGEPGRFWSDLTLAAFPTLSIKGREEWHEDGVHFGTGLQMVNILRDVGEDLARGRCYLPLEYLSEQGLSPEALREPDAEARLLPLYHRLINGTLDRLEHGLRYIQRLPATAPALRLAVWWPLVFGVKTLKKLRLTSRILEPKKKQKISRVAVVGSMAVSAGFVYSNWALEKVFERERNEAEA